MRKLSPVQWAVHPLKHYADFKGRAPRAEFWWFYLLCAILDVPIGLLANAFAAHDVAEAILRLPLFLPMLAVSARRLHDINRSALWLLTFLAAIILIAIFAIRLASLMIYFGSMLALVAVFIGVMAVPGTNGPNDYGSDPYQSDDLKKVFA